MVTPVEIKRFPAGSAQDPQRIKLRNLVVAICKAAGKEQKIFPALIKAAGKIIPEFGRLNRTHNSDYHRHDMDVHTFELVSRLLDDPAAKPKMSEELVLAALLHDIGKPASETVENGKSSYVEHAKIGTEMTKNILTGLGITDEKSRQVTLEVVRLHMRPVELINQAAKGNVPENALKNFIKDVVVPLEKLGIDLDTILAFGRADILASQGPESYTILGVAENTENSYIKKTDELVKEAKAQIMAFRGVQRAAAEKAAALKSCPVNSDVLKEVGFKPGPQFGKALKTAVELANQGFDKEAIVARLKELYPIT